jgi:hypothetical protein
LQKLSAASRSIQLIYFRTVPKFETGSGVRWLMEHIFVGSAARRRPRRDRRASGAVSFSKFKVVDGRFSAHSDPGRKWHFRKVLIVLKVLFH